MSHYVECQTEFRDPQALVAALIEGGFAAEQVEIQAEVQPLYGYQGDRRAQQAHIIVRRQHVGQAANDVGWERQPGGTYRAWISEYDVRHRIDQTMQDLIKQTYAYCAIERQQRARGRKVTRTRLPSSEIELVVEGYSLPIAASFAEANPAPTRDPNGAVAQLGGRGIRAAGVAVGDISRL